MNFLIRSLSVAFTGTAFGVLLCALTASRQAMAGEAGVGTAAEYQWQPAAAAPSGTVAACGEASFRAVRDRTASLYREAQKSGKRDAFSAAGKSALDYYRRCGASLSNAQRAWLLTDYALTRIRGGFGDCAPALVRAAGYAMDDVYVRKAVAFNRNKCAEDLQQHKAFTLDDVKALDSLLRLGKESFPPPAICSERRVKIVRLKHGVDPDAETDQKPPVVYVDADGKEEIPCGDTCSHSHSENRNRIVAVADLNSDGRVEVEIYTGLYTGSMDGISYAQTSHDLLLACGDGRYVVTSEWLDEEEMRPNTSYGFDSITPLVRYDPKKWPSERFPAKNKKGGFSAKWISLDEEARARSN